jgi:hypothetical protein
MAMTCVKCEHEMELGVCTVDTCKCICAYKESE